LAEGFIGGILLPCGWFLFDFLDDFMLAILEGFLFFLGLPEGFLLSFLDGCVLCSFGFL
jgi:hypothetical protein